MTHQNVSSSTAGSPAHSTGPGATSASGPVLHTMHGSVRQPY